MVALAPVTGTITKKETNYVTVISGENTKTVTETRMDATAKLTMNTGTRRMTGTTMALGGGIPVQTQCNEGMVKETLKEAGMATIQTEMVTTELRARNRRAVMAQGVWEATAVLPSVDLTIAQQAPLAAARRMAA